MNDKQQAFCREYLVDGNATQAAIRAGYSKKTARQQGTRLLADVAISEKIKRLNSARLTKLDITAEKVLQEAAVIAFATMGDYMVVDANGSPLLDFSDLGPRQLAALAEVTIEEHGEGSSKPIRRTKFKLHNKVAALTLLAKHLNLLQKKQEDESETPAMAFVRALSGRMIRPRQLPPEAKRLGSEDEKEARS